MTDERSLEINQAHEQARAHLAELATKFEDYLSRTTSPPLSTGEARHFRQHIPLDTDPHKPLSWIQEWFNDNGGDEWLRKLLEIPHMDKYLSSFVSSGGSGSRLDPEMIIWRGFLMGFLQDDRLSTSSSNPDALIDRFLEDVFASHRLHTRFIPLIGLSIDHEGQLHLKDGIFLRRMHDWELELFERFGRPVLDSPWSSLTHPEWAIAQSIESKIYRATSGDEIPTTCEDERFALNLWEVAEDWVGLAEMLGGGVVTLGDEISSSAPLLTMPDSYMLGRAGYSVGRYLGWRECTISTADWKRLTNITTEAATKEQTKIGVRRLHQAHSKPNPEDAILDASIGLESILVDDSLGELALRFSLFGALAAADLGKRASNYHSFLRHLYGLRSTLAHGGKTKRAKFRDLSGEVASPHSVADEALSLLRDLLLGNLEGVVSLGSKSGAARLERLLDTSERRSD